MNSAKSKEEIVSIQNRLISAERLPASAKLQFFHELLGEIGKLIDRHHKVVANVMKNIDELPADAATEIVQCLKGHAANLAETQELMKTIKPIYFESIAVNSLSGTLPIAKDICKHQILCYLQPQDIAIFSRVNKKTLKNTNKIVPSNSSSNDRIYQVPGNFKRSA